MYMIAHKETARRLFGDQAGIARALCISPQAISRWPEALSTKHSDWIIGAAMRLGMEKRVRELTRGT